MFDPRLLDVAIGIIFLFLLVSLLVTIAQEAIASVFKLRARNLFSAVSNLLGETMAAELYKHPLIQGLYKVKAADADPRQNKGSLPSYLPSRTFVIALLDVLQRRHLTPDEPGFVTGANDLFLRAGTIVARLPAAEDRLKRVLQLLVGAAGDLWPAAGAVAGAAARPPATAAMAPAQPPVAGGAAVGAGGAVAVAALVPPAAGTELASAAAAICAPIEQWFNNAMDRAIGWYKRKAQLISVLLGLTIACATNADAVHVARRLWTDASLRASVTAAAETYRASRPDAPSAPTGPPGAEAAPGPASGALVTHLDANLSALETSTLPIGWIRGPKGCLAQFCPEPPPAEPASRTAVILFMLAGWTITGLATSVGAPFWFDLLNRALQLRSSGGRVRTKNDRPNKR